MPLDNIGGSVIALKPVLKRGALVAAANWQVTLVQATADSLFKMLIATPILGGAFLVALVAGTEPRELFGQDWRDLVATIVGALLSHPLVLTAFLLAVAVVAVGGSLFVFLIKGGTVATLVKGERQAGPIEDAALHLESFRGAATFSSEAYIEASRALFPRYARLGTSDIAAAVGFVNLRTFERAFRRQYGITPSGWRYAHCYPRSTAATLKQEMPPR